MNIHDIKCCMGSFPMPCKDSAYSVISNAHLYLQDCGFMELAGTSYKFSLGSFSQGQQDFAVTNMICILVGILVI